MNTDLNCDLGEGGENDARLMPLITSANIACAGHAGDEDTMRRTVALALAHGVSIGAHPGFADRGHFGRRELPISPGDAGTLVVSQCAWLHRIADEAGARVTHLKLHGALYNMASRDEALASGVLDAILDAPWRPALIVLAGSVMERLARERGTLRVVSEVFADRTYQPDGSLTPRSRGDALIESEDLATQQVIRMVREGKVRAVNGVEVGIRAETICLHGDGPHAVAFARRLRDELASAGVAVRPFSSSVAP